MSIVLQGSTSGSITLQEPAIAGSTVLNLPATSGTVVVSGTTPSFNGIAFPATQSASTDANTLDDYEEGSWTPTLTFSSGSVTYTARNGLYTKVGNLVTVSFWILVNTASSPSGTLTITGLPFSSNSTATRPAMVFRVNNLSGVTGGVGAWLDSTSTVLNVVNINNGASTDLNASRIVSNSEFDAFFTYQV